MKKFLILGLIAISNTLFCQAIKNIPTFIAVGAQFSALYDGGQLQGTLTSVGIKATLSASSQGTYGDDLTILVSPETGFPFLQVGGYSNFSAAIRAFWTNGGSSSAGTVLNDTYTLTSPINFTDNPTNKVQIGNGYKGGTPPTNSATWTNITVTLNGVTATNLGTTEITANSNVGVTVYPNPVVDVINVNSKYSKINYVSISDMTGKAVKTVLTSDKKNELSVNVSELSTGNYLLIINTEKGMFTNKFIKK